MKNNLLLAFMFCLIVSNLCGQDYKASKIAGVIKNNKTQVPIANVLVFQPNSSNYTETNQEGEFTIEYNRQIGSELQISHVGYVDKTVQVSSKSSLLVYLNPKEVILDEAVVKAKRSRQRKKWLKIFKQNFIGMSKRDTVLEWVNESAVLFTEKEKKVKAIASENIMINNKKTGYELHFDMFDFEYDIALDQTTYQGKIYFKDLAKTEGEYNSARELVYKKSVRNFLVSFLEEAKAEEEEEKDFEMYWSRKIDLNDFELIENIERAELTFVKGKNGEHILLVPKVLGFVYLPDQQAKIQEGAKIVNNGNVSGLIASYEDGTRKMDISYMESLTGKIIFNDFGIIQNTEAVIEYGYITEQRIGQMLPLDYRVQ